MIKTIPIILLFSIQSSLIFAQEKISHDNSAIKAETIMRLFEGEWIGYKYRLIGHGIHKIMKKGSINISYLENSKTLKISSLKSESETDALVNPNETEIQYLASDKKYHLKTYIEDGLPKEQDCTLNGESSFQFEINDNKGDKMRFILEIKNQKLYEDILEWREE